MFARLAGFCKSCKSVGACISKRQICRPINQRTYATVYNVFPDVEIGLGTADDREEFKSYYPLIVKDLIETYKDVPGTGKYIPRVLENNILDFKQASGFAVVVTYKSLVSSQNVIPDPENIRLANILGWCVNIHETCYLAIDDMIDSSAMRYGRPAWHKVVGHKVVNDYFFLENSLFTILKKYFSRHSCYMPTVEYFLKASMSVIMEQIMEMTYQQSSSLDLYNQDKLNILHELKCNVPAVAFPIVLAMYFNGSYSDELYNRVHPVLSELAQCYQTQNDIWDTFGHNSTIGRQPLGDIQEGKFNWLIMTALKHASSQQKEILEQHYGKPNLKSAMRVKDLFTSLNILDKFLLYEKEKYNKMCQLIKEIPDRSLQNVILEYVNAHCTPEVENRAS